MIIVPQTTFNDAISGNRNWSSSASWENGTIPDSHIAQVTCDNGQVGNSTLTVDGVYHIEGLTMAVTGSTFVFTISNGSNSSRMFYWNTPNNDKSMTLRQRGSNGQTLQVRNIFPDNATWNIENSGTGFHIIGSASSTSQNISANNLTINLQGGGSCTMDSLNSTINGGTFNITGGSLNYRYNSQALGNLSNPMTINYDNMAGSNLNFNNFTTGTLNEIKNNFNFLSSRAANFNISIFGNGAVRFTGNWANSPAINGNINFGGDSNLVATRYYQIDSDLSGLTFNNSSNIIHNSNGGYVVVNNSLPSGRILRIGNDTVGQTRQVMYGFRAKSGITIPNNIEIYVSNTAANSNSTNGYGIGSWDTSGSCFYTGQIILNPLNRTARTENLYLYAPGTSTSTYSQIISGSANCHRVNVFVDGSGTNVVGNYSCGSTVTILPGATLQVSGSYNSPNGNMIISSGNLIIPSSISINNLNCATSGSNILFNSSGSTIDIISVTSNITADGTLSFPDTSLNNGNYDIITWGGTITDNGFVVGTNNTGKTLALTTDTINKKIILGVT